MNEASNETSGTCTVTFFSLVSVAYVSRSGGMSNELNNIISRRTNGVYEGVAIGGDRYAPCTMIGILRYTNIMLYNFTSHV